ncbi:MAG: hypothetical protein VXZ53_02170, partial [Planctomycetota bacterium]|nr:hypothetical protein [Planctomycetota bacterium]
LKARPVQYKPTGQNSAGGGPSAGFQAMGGKPLPPQVHRPQLPGHWQHEREWVRNGPIDLTPLPETDWIPFIPSHRYLSDLSSLGLPRVLVLNSENRRTTQDRT